MHHGSDEMETCDDLENPNRFSTGVAASAFSSGDDKSEKLTAIANDTISGNLFISRYNCALYRQQATSSNTSEVVAFCGVQEIDRHDQ